MIKALIALAFVAVAFADIPAHCEFPQTLGVWDLDFSNNVYDNTVTCGPGAKYEVAHTTTVVLATPNLVMDSTGNNHIGNWTLVYDQGFEINLFGGSSPVELYAFFDYTQEGSTVTSFCNRTSPGWFHDPPASPGAIPLHWGCVNAKKVSKSDVPTTTVRTLDLELDAEAIYEADHDFIAQLNAAQSSWVAGVNPRIHGRPLSEIRRISGVRSDNSTRFHRRSAAPKKERSEEERKRIRESLPDSFDWRNVSGINYVGPMRDQLNCGSCYAFAGIESAQNRLAILTKSKTVETLLAPQDIVSCSEYSQGCDGGFPYLVGKFGSDFGLTTEMCFPYSSGVIPTPTPCQNKCAEPALTMVDNYYYVGGYYGACNTEDMMLDLVTKGPLAIGFEVYDDFMNYRSGVYTHVPSVSSKVNPFVATNHAVLVVGYGTDATGTDYWTVKNSWGRHFGDLGGYFLIKRGGSDGGECGCESMAVGVDPVVPT
jgi:cathepsin C